MIATALAIKGTGLPSVDLWGSFLERNVKLILYEDNTAMIKILKNGISPNLRHLNRTHGVSIAATSEIISETLIEVVYKKSNEMLFIFER